MWYYNLVLLAYATSTSAAGGVDTQGYRRSAAEVLTLFVNTKATKTSMPVVWSGREGGSGGSEVLIRKLEGDGDG